MDHAAARQRPFVPPAPLVRQNALANVVAPPPPPPPPPPPAPEPVRKTTGVNTINGAVGGKTLTARTFCITVNAEDEVEVQFPNAIQNPDPEFIEKVRYVIWQREKAPTTGHIHLQAYVELFRPCTHVMLKRMFKCPTMHIEKRYGTQEQAIDYCKKDYEGKLPDDGPFEYGTKATTDGSTGGRNLSLTNAVKVTQEKGVNSLITEDPVAFVKWHKGLRELEYTMKLLDAGKKDRYLEVMVFFGEPGSGKTMTAFDFCRKSNLDYYILCPPDRNQTIWFNGYNGQQALIIDEMNGNWISWTMILRMLDKYPLQLQQKGSMTWAQWTYVILTSNAHPKDWYPTYAGGQDSYALQRRITKIIHFTGNEKNKNWNKYLCDWDGVDGEKLLTPNDDE